MRKLSADYVFPIASDPIKNGVITIGDDGSILDVSTNAKNHPETEQYKGIICPGFINTHCHLELSHMRSWIPEQAGMADFIKGILSKRTIATPKQINEAICQAEEEMIENGIVAVADISNDTSTFLQKAKGNMHYHTFIEVFHPDATKAKETFEAGVLLEKKFKDSCQPATSTASLTPHAPYTMSGELLKLINDYALQKQMPISIHNQESEAEDELFMHTSGTLFQFLTKVFDASLFRKTGVNALRSTLPFLTQGSKILLVHNTFTSREDITWAESALKSSGNTHKGRLYWCTCPNANLYIENKLPNYTYFLETNSCVTIGTDSLASNWSLSVLDELKTITRHYPTIPLQTILIWATKNGADFLGLEKLGTIEKGKQPGLNLLKNIDNLQISDKTQVIKLI